MAPNVYRCEGVTIKVRKKWRNSLADEPVSAIKRAVRKKVDCLRKTLGDNLFALLHAIHNQCFSATPVASKA